MGFILLVREEEDWVSIVGRSEVGGGRRREEWVGSGCSWGGRKGVKETKKVGVGYPIATGGWRRREEGQAGGEKKRRRWFAWFVFFFDQFFMFFFRPIFLVLRLFIIFFVFLFFFFFFDPLVHIHG